MSMTSYHVRITAPDYQALLAHLLGHPQTYEEGAFMLAGRIRLSGALTFVVREVLPVPRDEIISHSAVHLDARPEFIARVLKRARADSLSVIQVHSHPFSRDSVGFSGRDHFGEKRLFPKIAQRVPGVEHGALVFGQKAYAGRVWVPGKGSTVPISSLRIVGPVILDLAPTGATKTELAIHPIYDRQVRALGPEGHRSLQACTVAVVGTGGNGCHVVQALARMGVGCIIAVEPDLVEESNQPRVVGSIPEDASKRVPKLKVMERLVRAANNVTKFIGIQRPLAHPDALQAVRGADILFSCTDNFTSRALLNDLAYLYLIPLIDMGLEVQPDENGMIRKASGYVITIIPGYPCLRCTGVVTDQALVMERKKGEGYGYLGDKDEPAAQVISFNGLVAYHAVTEFVAMVTGFRPGRKHPTYQTYDFLTGKSRNVDMEPAQTCTRCKDLLGLADIRPLESSS